MAALPSNVHVSSHPCLRAKLSQLRSKSTTARETKQLVHDIALMVGYEALASGLTVTSSGTVSLPPLLPSVPLQCAPPILSSATSDTQTPH